MDQRTRRRFIQTIETFFPRELCGEMEGYPTFENSRHKRIGLDSDFVCGPLSDAVDSGEKIVKCIHMPPLLFTCDWAGYGAGSVHYLYAGFWVMVSNKDRIIIYFPGRYTFSDMTHTKSSDWQLDQGSLAWIFESLPSPITETDHTMLDYLIHNYIHTYTDRDAVTVLPRALSSSGSPIERAWRINLAQNGNNQCPGIESLLKIMGYRAFLQSCKDLLQRNHATTPHQQRIFRQRQRVVRQSSDRIERSMTKIRDEFGRLETEMKKLGDLSSTLSTQRTFTVGQDGQFVSQPT